MQQQLGVFIYDTMNYSQLGLDNLEDFLARPKISAPVNSPALTKVFIPHRVGREIMERLDIVGATATLLFENPEGAATDVINGYSYHRTRGRAWNI